MAVRVQCRAVATCTSLPEGPPARNAVDRITGHARDDMASVYLKRIIKERLGAVADHVRKWLSGKPAPIGLP